MIAIMLAVQWMECLNPNNLAICSGLFSVLISIMYGKSTSKLTEILNSTYRLQNQGSKMYFVWVPSHVGVEANEESDFLAKKTLKNTE